MIQELAIVGSVFGGLIFLAAIVCAGEPSATPGGAG
jgi:hypothetical protein